MIRPVVIEAPRPSDLIVQSPAPAHESALVHGVVADIERRGTSVTLLRIRVPADRDFRYMPGQYIDVQGADGYFRSFSLACADLIDGCVELHIRRIDGGVFSDRTMRSLKRGDALSWRGPFGDFAWRGTSTARHAVFMCTGTGFAPVRAVIEEALAQGESRPLSLYWGGREDDDLYLCEVPRAWEREHANFRFIPVLSRSSLRQDLGQGPDSHLSSSSRDQIDPCRRGRVHDAVMQDFASLADADVYACGSPAMVATARETLIAKRGLSDTAFFSDPFGMIELALPTQSPESVNALQIIANGVEYSVAPDGTLLAALRSLGIPIMTVCGGRCACGTCTVEIDEGSRAHLPPPGRDERELLECLPEVTPRSRLACQIRLEAATSGLSLCVP
jgi:CDP-4-dehydro-6-deoxyglucose reductase